MNASIFNCVGVINNGDPIVPEIEAGLSRCLTARWGVPTKVKNLTLIPGGAARATWRCDAHGPGNQRGLIVRLASSAQLLPSGDQAEFLTTQAVYDAGLPVAEPLLFETDPQWLGCNFSVVAEVQNCRTAVDDLDPLLRHKLGEQKWGILGRIAAMNTGDLGLQRWLQPADERSCAMEQFTYWEKIMLENELHPHPVNHAAARWLRDHPPPPATKLAIVHGDYRTGNFLYDPNGILRAVLDWEMAHLGDPLEDLAWSLDPRQNVDHADLAGGLLPHAQAIACWERFSRIRVDAGAFRWWQIFAAFKALAIWLLSARTFHEATDKRPVHARIGWLLVERQQRVLLDYLSPHSSQRLYRYHI